MSNYRCRDHTDEPVTWRGTGCQQCAQEARTKQQRRDKQQRNPDPYGDGPTATTTA